MEGGKEGGEEGSCACSLSPPSLTRCVSTASAALIRSGDRGREDQPELQRSSTEKPGQGGERREEEEEGRRRTGVRLQRSASSTVCPVHAAVRVTSVSLRIGSRRSKKKEKKERGEGAQGR